MDTTRPGRISAFDVLSGLSLLAALAFLGMWLTSDTRYTSLGVDADRRVGDWVVQTHYRIRWPGNGSFFMGYDQYLRPGTHPLEPFNLGGAFFQEPRRPTPQSRWNEVGFWSLSRRNPLAEVPRQAPVEPWSFWWGVPAWMPLLLASVLPGAWWVRRRRAVRTG